MHLSKELKQRLKIDLFWVSVAVAIVVFVYLVVQCLFDVEFYIKEDTMRYLYSSLIQGFAALAALQLAILGFNHKMLRDSEASWYERARKAAEPMSLLLKDDLHLAVSQLLEWHDESFAGLEKGLEVATSQFKTKYPEASCIPKGDPERNLLRRRCEGLHNTKRVYCNVASYLGRAMEANEAFEKKLPADTILAVVPSFGVIVLSIVSLVTVDSAGAVSQGFAVVIAGISLLAVYYSARYFQGTLRIVFGGGYSIGFDKTGLPKPIRAEELIAQALEAIGESADSFGKSD